MSWTRICCYCVAILSAVVILAPKAAVPALILCALFSAISIRLKRPVIACFSMRGVCGVAYLLGILSVWILISSVWNFIEINTLNEGLSVLALIFLGLFSYVIISTCDLLDQQCIERGLIIGVCVAFIGMSIGFIYSSLVGDSLFGAYTYDPLTPLNDSATVMALFLWPMLSAVWRRSKWLAVFSFILVFGLLMLLSSFAAVCAVVVGCAVFLLRSVMRHNLMVVVIAFLAIVMLVLPNLYSALDLKHEKNEHSTVLEQQVHSLVGHRLAIWSFAVKKIEEQPWLGWGFRSSRSVPRHRESIDARVDVLPLHPHNISLQARLELGVPGIIIFVLLVAYILISLSRASLNSQQAGFLMAPAAAWLFIANVSFGMWQNWWIASAFLIAILMRISVDVTRPISDQNATRKGISIFR